MSHQSRAPNIMKRNITNFRGTQGFTLIEVLVAIVVLSIGLLGMAKMVMVSSHSNDSAYLRSQATQYAYAILDAMRANRNTALNQGYDTALGAMPANPGSCVGAVCANLTLAQYDVYTWKQRMAQVLPSGTASIVTVPAANTTAVIIVQWDDSAAQSALKATAVGAAAPMSVVLETVL